MTTVIQHGRIVMVTPPIPPSRLSGAPRGLIKSPGGGGTPCKPWALLEQWKLKVASSKSAPPVPPAGCVNCYVGKAVLKKSAALKVIKEKNSLKPCPPAKPTSRKMISESTLTKWTHTSTEWFFRSNLIRISPGPVLASVRIQCLCGSFVLTKLKILHRIQFLSSSNYCCWGCLDSALISTNHWRNMEKSAFQVGGYVGCVCVWVCLWVGFFLFVVLLLLL